MSDRPTNRADALLILCGLACLVVVIAHCQPPLAALSSLPWGWLVAMPGGIAVRAFFTLSGYLIGKGFYLGRYGIRRSPLWRYIRNRAARILPLYWAAVLIPAVCLAPSVLIPTAENDWVLLRYLTFTYNHTLPEQFNSPLWSLSTEVQFYVLAPLLFRVVRDRLRTVPQALGMIGVVLFSGWVLRAGIVWILGHIHGDQTTEFNLDFVRYVYTFLPANLDAFLCGLLLNPLLLALLNSPPDDSLQPNQNHYDSRLPVKQMSRSIHSSLMLVQALQAYLTKHLKGVAIIAMIGLFIQCTNWKLSASGDLLSLGPSLSIAAVCLFIVAFESGDAYYGFRQNQPFSLVACRKNPWRCWEIWGVLSYGIYVWHYPIAIWLLPKFGDFADLYAFAQRAIAVLMIAIVSAIISYLAIERPGANWLQKLAR
ncbi:MAG: acyltransferase [Oscillatoriales cyanobacterium]|nr:MAG: acyltransferase [Oscillatoriales cyanobacterium]